MALVVPDGPIRLLEAVLLPEAVQDHCRAEALPNVSYITSGWRFHS
jgi:hypothetical protein